MKCHFISLLLLLSFSCNTDEGIGGSSSIEGYVYNVIHLNDDYSFRTDTFPAAGEKIYINVKKCYNFHTGKNEMQE